MDAFEAIEINTGETSIFLRRAGNGPLLLLLHGFPQTHLMWRDIVPHLVNDFTVVCPDLRGYGQSGCPPSTADHWPYSKRAMAKDMISVMEQLGFAECMVAGHDRGGRVAYRMALDPAHVHAICEEFRAAYTIDHLHDTEDRKKANRVKCPVLVLWSAAGPVDTWYATTGGPLAMWRNWALQVQGWPVKGGHFFPEAAPAATAHALQAFFANE